MTGIERAALSLASTLFLAAAAAGCGDGVDPTSDDSVRNATYLSPAAEMGFTTLTDGEFHYTPPDRATSGFSVKLERYALGDVDDDGSEDVASVLVEQPGPYARLYRLHVGLNDGERVNDVAARLLGDRIAIDDLRIEVGEIVAAVRFPARGLPAGSTPTQRRALRFALTNRGLVQIDSREAVLDVEDPLPPGGSWTLTAFELSDSTVLIPGGAQALRLNFLEELRDLDGASGRLSGETGCNRLFANYRVENDGTLRLLAVATTRRTCPAELEAFEQRLVTALGSARRFLPDESGAYELGFVGGSLILEGRAPSIRDRATRDSSS